MGRFLAAATSVLLIAAAGCLHTGNKDSTSQKLAQSSAGPNTSKKLILEILETDYGVGRMNHHFVFLRIFSDRTVELHSKRGQDIKNARVSRGEVSQAQLDMILALVEREDVKNLPTTFRSTHTPIDFNWVLDFKIPRGQQTQQITLVNFSSEMARQNNKPYPEALMRLTCSVSRLRRDLKAETFYSGEECEQFVSDR
jgi:hypothetical protein